MSGLLRKFLVYTNLKSGMDDYRIIHNTIKTNVIFKGTSLWVLVLAILICCIGINMDSQGVVIGAMLISPFIGPINGMGYSVATYDFMMFKKAFRNFCFAIITALLASTLYFFMSPLSASHSSLLQTSTTIYDLLIAFLGGLAGIIAISSKNKGNIIAGAAIATALMPPLCTAGFGLANANWNFFLSAMYLFAINVVFIAISSVLICRVLRFPVAIGIEGNQKRRVHQLLTFISLVTLVPSIYFGYALVQRERFTEKANQLIAELNVFEGSYLLKGQEDARLRKITLIYGGRKLSAEGKAEILKRANVAHIGTATIAFRQGFSLQENRDKISQSDQLKSEVNRLNAALERSRQQADSMAQKPLQAKQLLREIQAVWPEIKSCSYAETVAFHDTVATPAKIIVLESRKQQPSAAAKRKIALFLQQRLDTANLKTFFN